MNYLTIEQVLFIHDRLIEETRGSHGLREPNSLEAAVARPRTGFGEIEFYPSVHDKAAALMESIIRNHPFVDGNKRAGLTSAGVMLALNGWGLVASQEEAYAFTMRIADDRPDAPRPNWEDISAWLAEQSRSTRS